VEIGYFQIWWAEQSESKKAEVRKLLKNKQLQFVGGGISMNDEATCYFEDIIDNMTLGHLWISETFGPEY
jgi:heptaprenylglyceryl phosphate synthase